jgi:hypothetical protein
MSDNDDFTSWLISEVGGEKAAMDKFRKFRLKSSVGGRKPAEVHMHELLNVCEAEGWMGWFKDMTVSDFIAIFRDQFMTSRDPYDIDSRKSQKASLKKAASSELETQRAIQALMQEINEHSVLTPSTIVKVLGYNTSDKIRRITDAMVRSGLIKPFGNRPFTFAKATPATADPNQ